ncbi:ATP-binding protein [Nocardioides kongjuensis]|uniref:histidine kinase n=1 Tax=Nocardioides kongjuensis TaxID=349522 RepID=A0A852RF63_9ACTN|nr:ATP-binding protein [Nocardioides kongjuensis]NYD29368.1 signal transduction histidine kinase [Nocardioides kongjuensis]
MAEFRTSARAVDMLGRQQIAGIPSAISELFKNAHDAYADNANADFIRYHNAFVIRDDGDGMSRQDFEQRWLTLGTSSKAVPGAVSQAHGRRPRAILGEKGIGRLAIAAIGPQTLVVSKAERSSRVAALIHWGVFELAHADLSQLIVPVVELDTGRGPDVQAMAGQILDNLRKLVTPDDTGLLERIERDLSQWRETDPSSVARLAGFDLATFDRGTAFVILPTSPDLEADLEPPGPKEAAPLLRTLIGFANTMTPGHGEPELTTSFRDHRRPDDVRDLIEEQEFFTVDEFVNADHHFQGAFDEYGQFVGTVSIFGGQPIPFPLAWTPARGTKTQCGPFKLNLAYVQGRAKQSKLEPNDYFLLTEKLDRYGGLYIYRDGIRVLPYGDSRFDWLDVELRRTKSASDHFFSYRRMFGAVEISREHNHQLREKAGREGFATNEAYRQFRAILQNFLLQVATEFFREGGAQAEIYEEGRLANERMEKARRARSKQVRARRSEYSAALDRFFDAVDGDLPEARIQEIRGSIEAAIRSAQQDDDPAAAADRLVRAELAARSDLRELAATLQVKRPRGVALSAELTRRATAYEATRSEIVSSLIEPAEEEISTAFDAAGLALDAAVSRRLRFDGAIELAVSEARALGNDARSLLSREVANVAERGRETVRDAHRALEEVTVAAQQDAATTDVSALNDEEFSLLRRTLESRVRAIASQKSEELRSIAEQLRSVAWVGETSDSDQVSLLDQVEQLESRVEALTDRSAQDFELVQIGMAVNIVTHEFENSIRSVRDNLRRLRAWAQQNTGLRPLYSDLRASFDHLDGYLKLFTPLHRRLYREPAIIRGTDVQRYLHDVFDKKLGEANIDLRSTPAFENMQIKMYPSTLYPVIVNLVDNAAHWLQQYSGERLITLDWVEDAIIVTDSGPGITLGDEEAIFEQGFSRKPAGSGYGLFVAREVLRRDGADIRLAEPSADRGARFEILLPTRSDA